MRVICPLHLQSVELKSGCKCLLFELILCSCDIGFLNILFQILHNWALFFIKMGLQESVGLEIAIFFLLLCSECEGSRGYWLLQMHRATRKSSRIPVLKCAGMYWQCMK